MAQDMSRHFPTLVAHGFTSLASLKTLGNEQSWGAGRVGATLTSAIGEKDAAYLREQCGRLNAAGGSWSSFA